ncbi:MAG TPA: PP2C family protein-serine/threonine phosphatase [Terracidiphilus sp.]|nr:PP2C family protein-serine/threonine phosphatase [Terracidiphilus sp.]
MLKTALLVLSMAAAVTCQAQNQVVAITNWRMHPGDNPAWASPHFNDSQWAGIPFDRANSFGPATGTRWYRADFQVPPDFAGQDLAVGMGPLEEVYDVYIDGVLVGRYGSWQPSPRAPFPRHKAYPIPAGLLKGPVGHIAIRQWRAASGLFWLTFGLYGDFAFGHAPEIGSRTTVEAQEKLHPAAGAIRYAARDLKSVLFLFAAVISFVLFSTQWRKAEYFYLGLFSILRGAPVLVGSALATSESVMARSWLPVLIFGLSILADAFPLLFLAALCPRIRRILQVGAVLMALFAVVAGYSFARGSYDATLLWQFGHSWGLAPFELIAILALLLDRSRGSLAIAFCLLLNAAAWAVWAVEFWLPRSILLTLTLGPFLVDLPSVTSILFVFVTLFVLYLRYRDEQARHMALDQDMAAARRMQEHLLRAGEDHPPGFAIDAVYRPAREVGGDFYRTVPLEDGSLLVILGDVSGKGLDAAMLVAVILGSLANETNRTPASLLAYLNKAVIGRTAGGFITACCARFYPGGRVLLANAGQISPYLDGRELQLENGFPLGVTEQATYAESEIQTGGRLTFLSDGVVEARNPAGELFGFERVAALAGNRATEIAAAAQRWGQEDDITVLSVARAPRVEAVSA